MECYYFSTWIIHILLADDEKRLLFRIQPSQRNFPKKYLFAEVEEPKVPKP